MRIGIDCRPLIKEKTGIGYYLWEILQAWGQSGIPHELWLYAPRDFKIPPVLEQSELIVQKRVVRVRPAELWMHAVLPWQLAKDQIDVYWGPNYAMPMWPIPIPSVLTIHDTVYQEFPETMKRITLWHNRLGLETYVKNCHHLLVPSQNTKRDLIRYLQIEEDSIEVTLLGVSERFELDSQQVDELLSDHGLTHGNYFLTVGTLEPRKNLSRVIAAFEQLRDQIPEAHLVVVGTKGWGNTSDDVSSKLDERVHYLGYVSDKLLAALYQKARCFVYVPLYEGFGLPPLEAMRTGTPVLVSNTSSLPEVVADAGVYANPNDPYEIAEKMIRLWSNDRLRNDLIVKGTARAAELTWERTAAATLKALLKIGGEWRQMGEDCNCT